MTKPFRLPFRKRVFTHHWFQDAASWLVALILKCSWCTYRITYECHDAATAYVSGEKQAIFCFWHGRMIIFPRVKPKGRAMHVLISHHRDGQLIAKVIRHFGVDSVRGSSSRGARAATRALADMLAAGDNISITPDGPRGPAQIAQKGAVMLAHITGQPLVPVSFSAAPSHRLSSWDKFMIPYPFSRVMILIGEPIHIPQPSDKTELESYRTSLENRMSALTDAADRHLGIR